MQVATLEQQPPRTLRAIGLGVLGACFFSSTFLLNRWMAIEGGHWVWSASLRFGYTALLLCLWLAIRGEWVPFWRFFRSTWRTWLLWGTVGFGGFYAFLCAAAAFSPAWLVAGAFQLVLVSGLLLAPFIYDRGAERARLHLPALRVASLVVAGALLMQVENIRGGLDLGALFGFVLVLISTVLYPLGNRKILHFLETQSVRLPPIQIVLGMTLGSLPFWLLLALFGAVALPPPTSSQLAGTLAVALIAGIVATALFYAALSLAGTNGVLLGAVEATQSVELLATVLLEVALLHAALPGWAGWIGMALVVIGIVRYARLR